MLAALAYASAALNRTSTAAFTAVSALLFSSVTFKSASALALAASAAPARVFRALSDAGDKRRWYAEGERGEVEEFTMDFRVGGSEVLSFRAGAGTPIAGMLLVNRGTYLDIVENERVVMASTMGIGEMRFSASMSTFELVATRGGTRLVFTEQDAFFPNSDGPQLRKQGWLKLLGQLEWELEE